MDADSLLTLRPEGLFCKRGGFYIDPWRPVERAVITHAHSDHARWGMGRYLAHPLTAAMIRHRLGAESLVQTLEYQVSLSVNGVGVSFHPAGHVPGSSQVRVEFNGEIWVVTGDYKLEDDGLSTPFESVKCHRFISECTFGMPIFRWQRQSDIFATINQWWRQNQRDGRTSIISAYSLGKAQRILTNVDLSIGPVYVHGSIGGTNAALQEAGLILPAVTPVHRETRKEVLRGALVIAPPAVIDSPWMKRFSPYAIAAASGWMAIRGMKRRRAIETGFILSDHADFPALVSAIKATEAEHVYVTHGYTASFSRYLNESGVSASELQTSFIGEALESAHNETGDGRVRDEEVLEGEEVGE